MKEFGVTHFLYTGLLILSKVSLNPHLWYWKAIIRTTDGVGYVKEQEVMCHLILKLYIPNIFFLCHIDFERALM